MARREGCCVFAVLQGSTIGWYAHCSVSVPRQRCWLLIPCGNCCDRLPWILRITMPNSDIGLSPFLLYTRYVVTILPLLQRMQYFRGLGSVGERAGHTVPQTASIKACTPSPGWRPLPLLTFLAPTGMGFLRKDGEPTCSKRSLQAWSTCWPCSSGCTIGVRPLRHVCLVITWPRRSS